MLGWFRGKKRSTQQDAFFDYDDSLDPWASPSVRFFGEKKAEPKEKGSRLKTPRLSNEPHQTSEREPAFWEEGEDVTPRSYLAAASKREASRAHPSGPVVISPEQRLYDVSPGDFVRSAPPGPTLSRTPLPASPLQNPFQDPLPEIQFAHQSPKASAASSAQKATSDSTRQATYDAAFAEGASSAGFPSSSQKTFQPRSPEMTPDSPRASRPQREEMRGSDGPYRPSARPEDLRPDTTLRDAFRPEEGVRSSGTSDDPAALNRPRAEELGAAGAPPKGPQGPANASSKDAQRGWSGSLLLWLKIVSGVIVGLVLIAFAVSWFRKPSAGGADERILEIPSPAHIKVKPKEPDRALIPYQDELIYGQLDGTPEPEATILENSLPANKEVSNEDQEPVEEVILTPQEMLDLHRARQRDHEAGRSPSQGVESRRERLNEAPRVKADEEPEDEYLEEADRVKAEPSASRISSARTPDARQTQKNMESFLQQYNQEHKEKQLPIKNYQEQTKKNNRLNTEPPRLNPKPAVEITPASRSANHPASKPSPRPTKPAPSATAPNKKVFLQLGTLNNITQAREEATRLAAKYRAFAPYSMTVRSFTTQAGKRCYRILLGPLPSTTKALELLKQTSGRFQILP